MSEIRRFIVRPFLSFLIIAIVGLLLLVPNISAQQLDTSLYSGLRWRLIGPFRGGRINAVSGVPGQPETFYYGSVGGGVWKTNNAGRTWNSAFDSQNVGSIGAIGVAPSNPNVVYVGTGEADMRDSIQFGDGMYKSIDGGKTWTHIGLEKTRSEEHTSELQSLAYLVCRLLLEKKKKNKKKLNNIIDVINKRHQEY